MFPTPVGMNRVGNGATSPLRGVPHARGDEPGLEDLDRAIRLCSPRPWG